MIGQTTATEPAAAEQESPLEHIVQHPLIERPAHLGPLTPDGVVTIFSDQIAVLLLAGVLLVVLLPLLVRKRRGAEGVDALVVSGSANAVEAICQYLRKEVAEPTLQQHTDRFIKYIWSAFFFVLTVNVLGLLPIPAVSGLFGSHIGGTATGNIWVTATLAVVTMGMMVVNGLRLGGRAYLAHFFNPERDEKPHTLIGVETTGDWNSVMSGAGIVARDVPIPDPPVDFLQITGKGGS
jgi:F0F1-type ATP synthase membrane subunit a